MLINIPFVSDIYDKLKDLVDLQNWIDKGYNFVSDLSWIEQFGFIVFFGIVTILGVFSLIKKLTKLIIVIAILFGIWLLFTSGIL